MKKIFSLIVFAIFCIATIQAQTKLSEENVGVLDNVLAEYTEPDSTMSSYFEAVQDASFPMENNVDYKNILLKENPDQTVAALLNIFLGDFGVGHFYTGQTLRGVLDILFCWTGIPAIIGLIEGIIWLCDDDAEWAARVAKWNS